MKDKSRSVLLTLDSMKFPNTGLFFFGRSLSTHIQAMNSDFNLHYYVDKSNRGVLGPQAKYINYTKIHRLYNPFRNSYGLVHFTDQFCRLRPRTVNGKKILTIHDLNIIHEALAKDTDIIKHLKKLKRYIEECDKIVAISEFVSSDITTYFNLSPDKLEVIYNGADYLTCAADHQPAIAPKGEFLFTIGILSAKKNFHTLPALLLNNNYTLIISGIRKKEYEEKIIAEAQRLKVEKRVVITGTISDEDKAWYYEHCRAFVFPSLAEGFGLPVIEAMYHGKPVFLSKFTSLPEIGGDVAFYFDSFDADDMNNTLTKGLESYDCSNMGNSIIKHARKFSWEKTAENYLELYHRLLKDD